MSVSVKIGLPLFGNIKVTMSVELLETHILALPTDERKYLIERLFASLDEENDVQDREAATDCLSAQS